MSSTSHDPFEGFDPTDLEGSFAAIEKAITSSEPIVRDFNRHFTDLLGACPSSIDGKWLNLSQSGEATFHLTLVDAFRLTTALQEIARLVDFAEVEKFLDTPVKRYSSGMYVRLAFAVAAHLEPEILIVDEVLAVGDADFQKK